VTVAVEQAAAVLDVVPAIDQPAGQPGVRPHSAVDHGHALAPSGGELLGLFDPQPLLTRRLGPDVVG